MKTQRNQDFIDQFTILAKRYIANGGTFNRNTIVEHTIAMSPRRYYLDPELAIDRIRRLRKDRFFAPEMRYKGSPSQRMWRELYSKSRRYMLTHRHTTLADAIRHIVENDRPSSFFISQRLGVELSRKVLRGHFKYQLINL